MWHSSNLKQGYTKKIIKRDSDDEGYVVYYSPGGRYNCFCSLFTRRPFRSLESLMGWQNKSVQKSKNSLLKPKDRESSESEESEEEESVHEKLTGNALLESFKGIAHACFV